MGLLPPLLALLTLLPLQAGTPLAVVRAEREGLPPYEDNELRYRLEGDGAGQLRPGQLLVLARPGDRRCLGQLEVLDTAPDHVLARIHQPGATFPMRGDLAVPLVPVPPLPPLPPPAQPLVLTMGLLVPPIPPRLQPPPPVPARQEPIFFLPDSADLTPGALAKLKSWVEAWGKGGHWVLALPPDAATPLDSARIKVLRDQLALLGVTQVEQGAAAQAPSGKYPAVMVLLNPL